MKSNSPFWSWKLSFRGNILLSRHQINKYCRNGWLLVYQEYFSLLAICRYLTTVMTQIWWSKFPLWPLFLLGNTVPSNNPPTILKDFNWSLLLTHFKYIYICDFKVMDQNIYENLFLKCSTHKTTWSEIVNGAFEIFRVPNFNIEKYYGCYPSLIKLRYFHKKWKNLR